MTEQTSEKELLDRARRMCLQHALDTTNQHEKYILAASKITDALNALNNKRVRPN